MALIHIEHTPATTKVNQALNLIVPDPARMEGRPVSRRKVLYLLHGLSDDASAWGRFSTIETLAAQYGLVVVMPSAGRSFYTDQANGQRYFTYLIEELPKYLADVFNLRPRREDTYLAGLSMGGYGAFKAGLLYPERFTAVASFSGVLSVDVLRTAADSARLTEFGHLFGDLDTLAGSEHDPAVWLYRAAQAPAELPRLFISCGRQDDLYPLSKQYAAACQDLGVAVDYHEEEGRHDWPFWDRQIQRFLTLALHEPMPV